MKKQHIFQQLIALVAIATLTLTGCEKEWDTPPLKTVPEGNKITLKELKAYYNDTTGSYKFTEDLSVYCTVTADERSGNLYKNVYVQDETDAINVRLLSGGGVYIGDYVRLYLKGTVISKYNDAWQLDSVDTDNNIIKQSTQSVVEPRVVTIDSIVSDVEKYEGYLVQLNNAEFSLCGDGGTYADKVNQLSVDRTLTDCNGGSVIVRTSGYSDFAGTEVPTGGGSIMAIVGNYRGTPQLLIRDVNEVKMDGLRCNGSNGDCSEARTELNENFGGVADRESACLECWSNVASVGSRDWEGSNYQGESYVECTAYQSTDAINEMWLVSPPMEFNQTDVLSFQSQLAYDGVHDGLSVWISPDYDGNPATATWSQISANVANSSSTSFAWVDSGDQQLFGFLPQGFSGTYHIGFKYVGTPSSGETTTYRLDNVRITQ